MKKENRKSNPPGNVRSRAEKFLSEQPETLETVPASDIRKLIHELEVHQIELEMQNEELRRIQHELIESRNRYYDLYDFAPIGYFTVDDHSLILEANLTGASLLGIERRRLNGNRFSGFISPESQDQYYLHRNKAFETRRLETCELIFFRADSSVFHANLETIAVQDEEGVYSQLLIAITDISTRKQAEDALKISEEKYRELYDKAPNAYFSVDASNGAILNCNKAARRMLGYPRKTLLSMKVFKLYADSPKGLRKAKRIFKRLKAGESIRDVELQMKHQKGEPIWVSLSVEPVRDLHGKIIESRSMVIDITERKRAEEDLRKAHDELEIRVEERTAELLEANTLLEDEISERKRIEVALKRRDIILEAVSFAAEHFLTIPSDDIDIHNILKKLGLATEASRVYIFENHTDENGALLTSQRYEWAMHGIKPEIDNPELQKLAWSDTGFARWKEFLSKGQPVKGPVSRFPESERALLTAQGILSLAVVPIHVGNAWWGFLGFDECRTEREWSTLETDSLKAAASILGAAIQRRQTEQELRDSEKKYSRLVENSLTGIFLVQNAMIAFANNQFAEIFGYSKEELIGEESTKIVVPEDRALLAELKVERMNGKSIQKEYDIRGLKKDGTIIWTRGRFTVTKYKASPAILGNVVDVTRQKQTQKNLRKSEENLRALSSKLIVAQEEERKRIALELHDGIGQSLSAIKYRVEMALREIEKEKSLKGIDSLAPIVPMVQGAVEEVRKIQRDLRPSILDDLGILATVSWFCRQFEDIYTEIHIEKQIDIQENDVPNPLKIVIFRITQEALNNITKHSYANLVRFSLRHSDGRIMLSIDDDGVGFDVEGVLTEEASARGLGLTGMRERAQFSGGTFKIASSKGAGTSVLASWPVGEQTP